MNPMQTVTETALVVLLKLIWTLAVIMLAAIPGWIILRVFPGQGGQVACVVVSLLLGVTVVPWAIR